MTKRFSELSKAVAALMRKNKYILPVILIGALLLILPTSSRKDTESISAYTTEDSFSVEEAEKKLAGILSETEGAGRVSVMLSVKGGTERVVAVDEEESEDGDRSEISSKTVVISNGASTEEAIVLKCVFPEYTGAIIVAEGAGNSAVRLSLTEAVSAVTGLGANKITVIKMK